MTQSDVFNVSQERVAVLDAGGQYVDLVQKATERLGIPADVVSLQTPLSELEDKYQAIIISGSPASSHEAEAPQPDAALWSSTLPILGICYGMQSMAIAHGGSVAKSLIREDGRVTTHVDTTHPLFKGNKADLTALFTHGDFVTEPPQGFRAIGQHALSSGAIAYSAIASGNKVGVQFHPEVFDDTPEGFQVFQNFLFGIAGLAVNETFQETRHKEIIVTKRVQIVEQVAGRHVFAFMSGGVDSSVAGAIAAPVIPPEMLHAYYIDNGFMRYEDDQVIKNLQSTGIPVTKIDAAALFEQATIVIDGEIYGPLVQEVDPERKRKIIGKTFIDVENDLIKQLNLTDALLLQGTNAADRIESGHSKGGAHTQTIKTHHNQVQEVQDLKARGLLIEPLDDLFKDEVRALGRELGLSEELVERQPFPGPGLAIRIIASTEDRSELPADPNEAAIREFIARSNLQTRETVRAHVLPIRSVGVGGDERSHVSVVAIDDTGLEASDLAQLASDIPAHFRGQVNRVIYALQPGSLAERSVTKTLMTSDVREQLRNADRIVFEAMRELDLLSSIKQLPVVLLPISFGKSGERSIVLRPVTTTTFMTVQAMLPKRDLPSEFFATVTERIMSEVPGISQVFLDLTNKPPGTTEWE